ncbi:MAG TPA: hypothetical protein VKS81_02385 [Bacteroidota bacterium]|nr:hypothetical protein [Bacteroidota bacterium]
MPSNKFSVGLFVDGTEIKLAKLSVQHGNVVIEELESHQLSTKLEEQRSNQEAPDESASSQESAESFSLDASAPAQTAPEENAGGEGGGDNSAVLVSLLSKYPPGKYSVSYAISEPSLYYHIFETDFGLSGKRLKNRVLEELGAIRGTKPAADSVDYFFTAEKNLVAVIRENGLAMLHLLDEAAHYMGRRVPKLPLIDSADMALLNVARANFGFAPEEYTGIVYVGVEFSRIIFMKGSEFLHFAPVLGEGFDSPNVRNTVYSRLLLEQDNVGIPRVDKIILAGESHKIQFDEFLREQLPEVEVVYLTTPYLDTSTLSAEDQEKIPEFIPAIAVAWKALDEEHPAFYNINLLPSDVRESQRAFKLAWHGYLLLVAVFVMTIYFTGRFSKERADLSKKENTVTQLRVREDENNRLQGAINNINIEIGKYDKALAIYDTMVPGSDRWSKSLEHLAKGAEDLNSLWIDVLQSTPDGGMLLKGYALDRSRIPRIAALFDNATLSSVQSKSIRDNAPPVFAFEMIVPPPPKDTSRADTGKGAAK